MLSQCWCRCEKRQGGAQSRRKRHCCTRVVPVSSRNNETESKGGAYRHRVRVAQVSKLLESARQPLSCTILPRATCSHCSNRQQFKSYMKPRHAIPVRQPIACTRRKRWSSSFRNLRASPHTHMANTITQRAPSSTARVTWPASSANVPRCAAPTMARGLVSSVGRELALLDGFLVRAQSRSG